MTKTIGGLFLLTSVNLMAGCSVFQTDDHAVDPEFAYVDAHLDKALAIPEGLDAPQVRDEYPVPETKAQNNAPVGEHLSDKPPTLLLAVGKGIGVVKSDEYGGPTVWFDYREIEIWQAIKDFMERRGYRIAREDRKQAIIETDWIVEDRSSWWDTLFGSESPQKVRDRYRFVLRGSEQGTQRLLTVQPVAHEVLLYDAEQWQSAPMSSERTKLFMNQFLGDWAEQQDRRILARLNNLKRPISLKLHHDNDDRPALIAEADYNIVWGRLNRVLPELGFKILKKDAALGTMDVEYQGEQKSWLASLFSDDEDSVLPKREYRVQLSDRQDVTMIKWLDEDGEKEIPLAQLTKIYQLLEQAFSKQQ